MDDRDLNNALVEKAKKELKEIPERNHLEIELLRDWLARQPHLNVRSDELWLLNILRYSKFCQEKARKKVEIYYSMKNLVPEFHKGRDPLLPEIQEILNMGIFVPLETPEKMGVLIRWQNADPKKATFVNILKVGFMLFDMFANESHSFMITGQYIIDDLNCLPFGYLTQVSPSLARKMCQTAFQGYPARIKGFYFINTPFWMEAAVNMTTAFLSEKIRSRIKMFSKPKLDEFYKHFPRSVLPTEYGGEAGSVAEITAKWKCKFESYRDKFLAEEQYRLDETRRPGNQKAVS